MNSKIMTLEQFQKKRTEIISRMLDNPDENEIYPTSKCYCELDKLFCEILDSFRNHFKHVMAVADDPPPKGFNYAYEQFKKEK